MTQEPDDVLKFWLQECSPEDWYKQDDALDATIRDRFEALWEQALAGKLGHWWRSPKGCLAFLILTDQFPRNMFRGTAKAFATDELARDAAKRGIEQGLDLRVPEQERQFFYLPLEHSECITDQDRAVRLIASRMKAPETLLHARAHREIIRQFGRFPFRNDALGRISRACEAAFLKEGGYGSVIRGLKAEA
ncbi:MAG: DUF924 family protein [Pseudomonadota bacterium]